MSNSTLRRSASCFTSSITGTGRRPRSRSQAARISTGLFFDGERRVAKLFTNLSTASLAFANLPVVDDEVVPVGVLANKRDPKTKIESDRGLRPVGKI